MKKLFRYVVAGATALALFAISPASLSPMPADAATGYAKHQLENYPLYLQGINNCWAATSASMYAYKDGSWIATEAMYSKFHDVYGYFPSNSEGIDIYHAAGLLRHVFEDWRPGTYEVNIYHSFLTQNQIRAQIDNDMPVYVAGCRYDDNNNLVGHAEALVGYKKSLADGNIYGIYCMNPQVREVQYSPYSEEFTHVFKYANGEAYYTWNQSITIF